MAKMPQRIAAIAQQAGVRLETSEIGFFRREALAVLKLLEGTNVYVLGGDVYRKKNENWVPTYDNWYCEPNPNEPELSFAERSRKRAGDYIAGYPDSDEPHLFVLVF